MREDTVRAMLRTATSEDCKMVLTLAAQILIGRKRKADVDEALRLIKAMTAPADRPVKWRRER